MPAGSPRFTLPYLGFITAGTLNIGNANSGTITVSSQESVSSTTNVNLTCGGDIVINAASAVNGGTITLTPGSTGYIRPLPGTYGFSVGSGKLVFAHGANLALNLDTFSQLPVFGTINLSGVNLVLSGNNSPTLGQSFVVAQATGGPPALTGTFNGLPEGTTLPNFLGSGASAVVSYLQNSGKYVTLTVASLATSTVVSSFASSIYGQIVTFNAAPSPANKSTPIGNVEFFDDTTGADLGAGVLQNTGAGSATWAYATLPTQLKVTGSADTIRAVFAPTNNSFFGSSGTLVSGHYVLARPLTIVATTNTKTYDAIPSASGIPTVSGLQGTDSVTGLAEVYADINAGSSKTLSITSYTINDGDGGNNYSVTTDQ